MEYWRKLEKLRNESLDQIQGFYTQLKSKGGKEVVELLKTRDFIEILLGNLLWRVPAVWDLLTVCRRCDGHY